MAKLEEVFEYGNTSKKLKRKNAQGDTHEWIMYVRPPRKDGRFIFVDKTGWGHFTVMIEVLFKYGLKSWEGQHELIINTEAPEMSRQPDQRIGTTPVPVTVQFDLMSMSQENRAQLWIDRTKAYLTRVDPEWESKKGSELVTRLSVKELRDTIRAELKLINLTAEEFMLVKQGLAEAVKAVLADAKAKAANKRRRSSTSSAGPAAKRSANGINQAQVKAMEKLRTQILDLPDDRLAELHEVIAASKAHHTATKDTFSFDLFSLDDVTLLTIRRMLT